MGKVMPRYIPKPAPKKEEQVKEEKVAAVPTMQGGFACPEMAMGKVIIRREQPVVTEAPVVESKIQETVEAKVEAPVVEAPVVEAVIAEKTESAVVETASVEPIVETPATEPVDAIVETAPAEEPVVEAAKEIAAEAPVAKSEPKVEAIKVAAKLNASAPMTKAPGPQELREITVAAAPFKTERYQAKGAGSQVAKNRASAEMTKPNFN